MKYQCAVCGFHVFKAANNRAFLRPLWVTFSSHHYTHRALFTPFKGLLVQCALAHRLYHVDKIILPARQDGFRLRIAEPAVKFEQMRTLLRDHQAKKYDTAIQDSPGL